jgi:adenosylmethionine-8-amino-7-oxononanoate aminotransferase
MKAVCDKYGALLIIDEVMSGMGRCGEMHAWMDEDVGVVPDIQTIGKGLGGGYAPVAGMLIGPKVFHALDHGTGAFQHGQTYQGHPISCAAALAVNKILRQPGMMEQVKILGTRLERGLRKGLEQHPYVGDIRGKGLFWGIEFVRDKESKEPFDPTLQVAMGVHELGMTAPYSISIYPGSGTADGVTGDHVLLGPAYTCTEDEIDLMSQKTVQVIEDYFHARPELSKGRD